MGEKLPYVPRQEDISKVLEAADEDELAYLVVVMETLARINEINKLKWEDIDLDAGTITLYTYKSKGGNLRPRKVPMTKLLRGALAKRFQERDKNMPWVFWHRYMSRKHGKWVSGPYAYRKRLMGSLCKRAGVEKFGFHALRHAGASLMDRYGVPLGSIQRILGHTNRRTTEIYLHSIGDAERDAMDVYEKNRKSPT